MSKKHKKKRYYTISVTTNNSADTTKYYRSRVNIFRLCILVTILITAIAVGLTLFEFRILQNYDEQIATLREIITKQESQIEELGDENATLTERNTILLSTVGRQQVVNEEQEAIARERALPTAFPLTDSATIVQLSEDSKITDPILVFSMSDAADAVACGDGVVINVRQDEEFGNLVMIDHNNGYISIYRNMAEPKVQEGDEVVRGAIIFVGGLEDDVLGFQITLDGEYIDPLEILEING